MLDPVLTYLRGLGPLRWMLCSSVILMLVMRPAIGTDAVYEGLAIFPTLLFPTLAPILFMVLLLDAIMSRLLMTSKQGEDKNRLRRAVWTDLSLAGLSALVWYPYFAYLIDG